MARDLVTPGAGCLTPAETELVQALQVVQDERELDAAAFAAVEAFASAECPVMPAPSQDEVRGLINRLAGTLKSPRMSLEQGQLQLSMYWAALRDVELFRLQLAAAHFIRTAEWMPTPGQVRTQALGYGHPVYAAHSRARRLARDRRQRLHEETMRALRNRTLSQEELDRLSDAAKQSGIGHGELVPTPEGGIAYRTRETLDRWLEHNRSLMIENRKDE